MLPLDGVLVLEIGSSISASYCCKILADYGANIVKIETIDGDSISTGRIKSNDWNDSPQFNNYDGTEGSIFDLDSSQLHLGGSGSKAAFHFDGLDLRTSGSVTASTILVGKNDLKIIDFEQAFYGPFGYDFGHLYGHFLLNYFSLK